MDGPTARFAALVAGDEPAIPLDEACLLIAAHAYPELDVDAELARLDDIAAGCPGPDLDDLIRHVFGDLGFAGNTDDYRDPRNSYLNDVISRRVGIPITLAVVAIEVGRRIGLPLAGVGMPGHFLVRYGDVILDPFAGGRRLDEADCGVLLASTVGPGAELDPSHLAPVGTRAILARVLANLKGVFVATNRTEDLMWAVRLRTSIPGVPRNELADLGRILLNRGRFLEAAAALDELADTVGDPDAAGRLRTKANFLRARLN